jgi:hypothetical protein
MHVRLHACQTASGARRWGDGAAWSSATHQAGVSREGEGGAINASSEGSLVEVGRWRPYVRVVGDQAHNGLAVGALPPGEPAASREAAVSAGRAGAHCTAVGSNARKARGYASLLSQVVTDDEVDDRLHGGAERDECGVELRRVEPCRR